MRFWDSSAVVPLLVSQDRSAAIRREYAADPAITVWCLTRVEVWSAVCRLRRESLLDSPRMRTARRQHGALVSSWVEVDDVPAVRSRALRILETHTLRASDALQLAAALVLVGDQPQRMPFVTLDERLAEAAEREGFEVEGAVAS